MRSLTKKKPAKSTSPRAKKKTSARKTEKFSLKRLLLGEEKPDLTELESGSTTILDILSPTAVDTKSRDYIVVDGVFVMKTSPAVGHSKAARLSTGKIGRTVCQADTGELSGAQPRAFSLFK